MGKGIHLYCEKCINSGNNDQIKSALNGDFSLGTGFMYESTRMFYGYHNKGPLIYSLVKDKNIKDKIKELLLNNGKPGEHYGHELYYCKKCNELDNRFYFSIKLNENKYEPEYKCKNCENILTNISYKEIDNYVHFYEKNGNEISINCKSCNSNKIKILTDIMWD
jgi:hypothetical protein